LQAHQYGESVPETEGHQVGLRDSTKAGRLHSAILTLGAAILRNVERRFDSQRARCTEEYK
jgi:hypothetical protein